MVKYWEDVLREKTSGTQSEILYAQWSYDKRIIPVALQSVSNLFPHYSLHDESHSITILNNIARVIGKENIEKLSAIDIWLILEAAYCHDIGMVVSSEKIVESLNSPGFISFFKELQSDHKNGLYEFASKFKIEGDRIKYLNDDFSMELNDGIKFILAEYFRRVHADRSKEIINNPLGELSLVSPRGAIPPRIFKILGDICSCHTKDFGSVMELSFCEVGIDIEDAHPRFIACLLRIGDLLDLDNNRFSEVMLRTLTKVPVDTLNHKAKHLSIQSFRVDREVIEITANCDNYDTANITQHWFNYLNSEISSQMINWNKIVPNKKLGYLPTIGSLKVELSNYDYIDGKNKPRFTVDTDKALNLLKGAGIYDSPYQCVREIIQNAIDATLIRMWLENKDEIIFDSPQSESFKDIVKKYPIKIHISEDKNETNNSYDRGKYKYWKIEFEDNGTGISSHDLKYLMTTGSSDKNFEKSRIIDDMPVWMKPSGTFGIGFQSIFMLTDVVKIETKSFFNEEFQIIELNGPNSNKDGDILIQKKKTTHAIKPGSKICFIHKTEILPKSYSFKRSYGNASIIAKSYDPFISHSFDVQIGQVIDEVLECSEQCYIPVELKLDTTYFSPYKEDINKFDFFDKETSLEISFTPLNKIRSWRNEVFYKGQYIDSSFRFKFLKIKTNIHSENASTVITLNRNKIRDDYEDILEEKIFKAAYNILTKNFYDIFTEPEDQVYGSMFLHFYSDIEYLREYSIDQFDDWRRLEMQMKDRVETVHSLLSKINIVQIKNVSLPSGNREDLLELNGKELIIEFNGYSASEPKTIFFIEVLRKYFKHVKLANLITNDITLSDQDCFLIEDKEIIGIIKDLTINPGSIRAMVPCTSEFVLLRLNSTAFKPYVYSYRIKIDIGLIVYPKMLSPCVIITSSDGRQYLEYVITDKVYDWVYENRYDSKTTRQQIVDGYNRLKKKIDLNHLLGISE